MSVAINISNHNPENSIAPNKLML